MVAGRSFGSYSGKWLVGFRLTDGRGYLILPKAIANRLDSVSLSAYWRYVSRQLRRLGMQSTPETAWKALAN